MRRVLLEDLLRVSEGLREVPEPEWLGRVVAWCDAAHLADAVRKRCGVRAAARFGAAHLGGRVRTSGSFVSDRDAHLRLRAALDGVEAWRARA